MGSLMFDLLVLQAEVLVSNLREDVGNAASRAEHVRLTCHALEAERLLVELRRVVANV